MSRASRFQRVARTASAAALFLLLVPFMPRLDRAAAQGGFDLRRGSLAGSGGKSSGGNFTARTTTSQPDAGATSGGGFAVSGSIAQGDPANCTALVAASGVVASTGLCSAVRLAWFDNSGYETGYRILRGSQQIALVSTNATTYDDATAVPGVSYSYTVVGTSACADAAASDAAVGRRPFPPQAPTGVRVSGVVRTADSVTVSLAWNDNSADETSQTVYLAGTTPTALRVLPANATSAQLTFAAAGSGRTCLTVAAANCGTEAVSDSLCFSAATVAVSDGEPRLPTVFALRPFAPNPFASGVTVAFDVPRAAAVSLRVFDISGRLRRTLQQGLIDPGRHSLRWDGRDDAGQPLASGIYWVEMKSPGFRSIGRLTRIH